LGNNLFRIFRLEDGTVWFGSGTFWDDHNSNRRPVDPAGAATGVEQLHSLDRLAEGFETPDAWIDVNLIFDFNAGKIYVNLICLSTGASVSEIIPIAADVRGIPMGDSIGAISLVSGRQGPSGGYGTISIADINIYSIVSVAGAGGAGHWAAFQREILGRGLDIELLDVRPYDLDALDLTNPALGQLVINLRVD
jgi:hypothetical protein